MITQKEFIERSKKIHGNKYDYSETKYNFAQNKVFIICKVCGKKFEQRASNHLLGRGCHFCGNQQSHKSQNKTQQQFLEDAYRTHGDKYDYSKAIYKTAHVKILIICKNCRNEFWQSPHKHAQAARGCPICAIKQRGDAQRLTQQEFLSKATHVHGTKYDYSKSAYTGSLIEIFIVCKTCGHGFWQRPCKHVMGHGCPKCHFSTGEDKIDEWLKANGIRSETQKTFTECKGKRLLRFDFYLPDYNILIEYDGELHYKAVDYFGGEKTLKYNQLRDAIKTQYAKDNNITLIRIPYFQKDQIDQILSETILSRVV